ncbi:MAG: nitroreductase family protein [Planctomycetes bacterium]|nr:nitroreductase family protein [Planctomycetota bacterium]
MSSESKPNESTNGPESVARSRDSLQPDDGGWTPVSPLPARDFWDVLYSRRSIRKFEERRVPRELVDQVMHAGIWAPSSCNYQMWDLIAVDDPAINGELAQLSTQMGNAPVNIVVAYGRDFSEENYANIQTASALIENMSLAAEALGLGTFWITQTGGADAVRAKVGLPPDRMVVAVLALGYAKVRPKSGPKRRPLAQVTSYNHYTGQPIPSSTQPGDWTPELLEVYQRARVLNGLRHNKPRPWETRAWQAAIDRMVPEGTSPAPKDQPAPTWLDVLPCTGIITEGLSKARRGFHFSVVERSVDVAAWCANRTFPKGTALTWPANTAPPQPASYDVISCFYRLGGLAAAERQALWQAMHTWLKPGGKLLIGFVSDRSFHSTTEAMRAKRGGPKGVEYVLSPDPNIGPFVPLDPDLVLEEAKASGWKSVDALGLQRSPEPDELEFRTRNFSPGKGRLVRVMARLFGTFRTAERHGRFQFRLFVKE